MIIGEILTPEEVARILKVDKRTIYYWIQKKAINHIRINKKVIRFRASDVEEFIKNNTIKASDISEVVDEILSKIS